MASAEYQSSSGNYWLVPDPDYMSQLAPDPTMNISPRGKSKELNKAAFMQLKTGEQCTFGI